MPTGYTAAINDGIDFKTFAMNCARAFGACVDLRDEGGGGEIIPDHFEPSDYHRKAIDEAQAKLQALVQMAPAECERAAAKAYEDAETRRVMRLQEIADQRAKYEAMLAKVNAWTAPTPDHVQLQTFMRSQIEESIRFDCGTKYYEKPTKRLTWEEWSAERAAELRRDLEYHQLEHAEEIRRAGDKTGWVAALRASLDHHHHPRTCQ